MQRASKYILIILVAFLIPGSLDGAETFPKPQGLVNDFAGVVRSPFQEQLIEATQEILKKTGVPIVVVTMPEIGGQDYQEFANRLYEAWGIGKSGENRGVLIFLTVQERKMRIETGYGMEGILPDGLVGEIRDRYMLPYLRQDRYGEGLLAGTAAVGRILAEHAGVDLSESDAPAGTGKPARRRSGVAGLFFTLVFFAILLSMARRRGGVLPALLLMSMGRGGHFGHRSGGSGFGGFGGGFGGFGGGSSGGGGAGGGF